MAGANNKEDDVPRSAPMTRRKIAGVRANIEDEAPGPALTKRRMMHQVWH